MLCTPFLEEFIEEYGNCDDEIVYLRDGSLLSLHQFMSHVNTSNALTEGVEGVWKKESKFIRFHPNPGQEKTLERPEMAYSLPIKSAGPFECLMIRITSKKELTSSSLSFRRHIDPKSEYEAAIRSVRQLVGLHSSSCW